ncbi:P-loop containing nucleoside triphosphate hydrolase protein [Trichoderma afarasin]
MKKKMSVDSSVSSNAFGPNTKIHQGDKTVIHNYSSQGLHKAYYVIPFPRNEDVIHRPEIVSQLDKLLSPSKEGEYCDAALWGLGGSGKTQIALDYAYGRSRADPTCAIFWVHADNETSFARDCQTIARKLGLNTQVNDEDLFLAVRDRIELQQRWLLILDNADDVTRFGVGVADQSKSLLKYIPRGPGGTVLWTSRDKQIVALAGPRRGVQVPHMSNGEAEELLALTRNKNIRDDETQDARLLLKELQWLPLAISQAGSYMRRTSMPIKKYLSKLLEGRGRWEMFEKTQDDKHRRPDVSNSILETWNISIQHIRQESETTYKVLHTIAYVDNENIPLPVILTASATSDQAEQGKPSENEEGELQMVIIRLKELSFISARQAENDDDEPSFDMHKLVQDAIRYRLHMEDNTSETYFSGTALRVITNLFPQTIGPETLRLCDKYATHAMRISDWAELSGDVIKVSNFLGSVAAYFLIGGFNAKAEYVTKKRISLQKKNFGEEHPHVVSGTFKLARIYSQQGLDKEAEEAAKEALALSEKVSGEKHLHTINSMSILMRIYASQGRYKEVEKLQLKQLVLQQEVLGKKHPDTIFTMGRLASLYDDQELYHKSAKLKARILALCYEVHGAKSSATIHAIGSLAESYYFTGQLSKAQKLGDTLFSLQQDIHWEKDPEMLDCMRELAFSYIRHGHYGKAKDLQKRILSTQQGLFGIKHLDTNSDLQTLALIYALNGQFEEAEKLELGALALIQEIFGERHANSILAMAHTASFYYGQGMIDKAKEWGSRALKLRQEIYGDTPPRHLLGLEWRFVIKAHIKSTPLRMLEVLLDLLIDDLLDLVGFLTFCFIAWLLTALGLWLGRCV